MDEIAVIRGARELISNPNRWSKSASGPGLCALGALYSIDRGAAYHNATAAIGRHVPGGVSIPKFNDDPNTTHEDILTLFDKALVDLGALV